MRAIRRAILAGVAAAPLAAAARAQSPAPSGMRLTPVSDTLASYLVRGGDTVRMGTVYDELSVRDLGGVKVLHRVYRTENQFTGPSLDTLIDRFDDLRPIRQSNRSASGFHAIAYSATRATGTIFMPTGDSIAVDVALGKPAYNASSFDLVLRAAPLEEGWSATVSAFLATNRAVVPLTARVVGVELVDGEETWRVESEFTGMPVTFWISRRSRRTLRQIIRPQAGMEVLMRKPIPGVDRRGTAQ